MGLGVSVTDVCERCFMAQLTRTAGTWIFVGTLLARPHRTWGRCLAHHAHTLVVAVPVGTANAIPHTSRRPEATGGD
jgi:hypothetical protein